MIRKYKKWHMTQTMHAVTAAPPKKYNAFRGYFKLHD